MLIIVKLESALFKKEKGTTKNRRKNSKRRYLGEQAGGNVSARASVRACMRARIFVSLPSCICSIWFETFFLSFRFTFDFCGEKLPCLHSIKSYVCVVYIVCPRPEGRVYIDNCLHCHTVKLSISPNHSILSPGQPVLALTYAPG